MKTLIIAIIISLSTGCYTVRTVTGTAREAVLNVRSAHSEITPEEWEVWRSINARFFAAASEGTSTRTGRLIFGELADLFETETQGENP